MGTFQDFQFIKGDNVGSDFIKIDKTKRQITGKLKAYRYTDVETKQIVIYMPGLDISGYGSTLKKADEMLSSALGDYFDHLLSLSNKYLAGELHRNGWKKESMSTKVFSKLFVDHNGELQSIKAKGNKIETLSVIA
jgi:hypothetical protein